MDLWQNTNYLVTIYCEFLSGLPTETGTTSNYYTTFDLPSDTELDRTYKNYILNIETTTPVAQEDTATVENTLSCLL
ncbi:MAG: hypothetical protein QF535_13405 [Anaerolineales bacterium]|nr:hypothetical protein [Anaerolineales bacterium]